MNILFIGDIVGSLGCSFAEKTVFSIKQKCGIDIVIANGENSADGNGITPNSLKSILSFADVVTTGNHCFRRREIMDVFDSSDRLIRPANYPAEAPGRGYTYVDMGFCRLAVLNLIGTVFMESMENPFGCIDKLLDEIDTPNIIVDFHAESTSEKKALGFYLAGRVTALCGTHTHVQTSDEAILSGHTAYITDVGMCGAEESVLGVKKELAIYKQRTRLPVRFTESDNPPYFNGVIIGFDPKTGKADKIERLIIR
ncbi:MAG: TIGR00282 family metallophosphoesterase [Huintestinicola sp.]